MLRDLLTFRPNRTIISIKIVEPRGKILLSFHLTFVWLSNAIQNFSGFNETGTEIGLSPRVVRRCPIFSPPLSLFLTHSSVLSILSLSFIRTCKYVPTSSTHVELNFVLTKVRDKGKERTDERTGYRCTESLNRTCVVLSTVDSRTLTSACMHIRVHVYADAGICHQSELYTYVSGIYNKHPWTFWPNQFEDLNLFLNWNLFLYNGKIISYEFLDFQIFNKIDLIWKVIFVYTEITVKILY